MLTERRLYSVTGKDDLSAGRQIVKARLASVEQAYSLAILP